MYIRGVVISFQESYHQVGSDGTPIKTINTSWQIRLYRSQMIIITRMHSSRMRTARSSSRPGGVSISPPRTRHPPQSRHPPPEQTPPRDQAPPLPPPRSRHPPVDRMTDTCENITLPQLCWGR